MVKREIIEIDEEKCNGCGKCIPNCAEGAIKIVEGKARLVKDSYCDGLGACLGHCPQGAISIIEREADEFDEEEVHKYLEGKQVSCTQTAVFEKTHEIQDVEIESTLVNWPIQLDLIPVDAPFFEDADLLIMADCVPVAYPNLHAKLLRGRPVVIGCAKFDSYERYEEKFTEIFRRNNIRTVTVVTMEVACCANLRMLVNSSMNEAGKKIPVIHRTVTVQGELY